MSGSTLLLDERGERGVGTVRDRIGDFLSRSRYADIAVARVRLAALDLTDAEVGSVDRCRVLLGRLDAGMLLDTADAGPADAADRLRVLRAFAGSGRLEVRAAGMASWVPDFSAYQLRHGEQVGLLGAHYFGAPYPIVGPSFTMVVRQPSACTSLRDRFAGIWALGHDVLPAIRDVLERAHALAVGAAPAGGGRDRPRSRA